MHYLRRQAETQGLAPTSSNRLDGAATPLFEILLTSPRHRRMAMVGHRHARPGKSFSGDYASYDVKQAVTQREFKPVVDEAARRAALSPAERWKFHSALSAEPPGAIRRWPVA